MSFKRRNPKKGIEREIILLKAFLFITRVSKGEIPKRELKGRSIKNGTYVLLSRFQKEKSQKGN